MTNYQGDIFFNYGCFPRTWEDPDHVDPDTGFPGDNDPLDVCEIGLRIVATGDVRQVKVLGVLAMIDEGGEYTLSAAAAPKCNCVACAKLWGDGRRRLGVRLRSVC